MIHVIEGDDENIIRKCQEYQFLCTYDTRNNFNQKSVTDAIGAVLLSREEQSKRLDGLITKIKVIMEPLQQVIGDMEELARIPAGGMGVGESHQNDIVLYRSKLAEERDSLFVNLGQLEDITRVMKRRYIRVPVVGVINSGKSTLLRSALGGGINDRVKENLFPSAGAHKSCTGTRTVLIYDSDSENVTVIAKFKDKATFLNDCRQSVRRMIGVLKNVEADGRFMEIDELQKKLQEETDPIALLSGYAQSTEFGELCKIQYKDEKDAESVHDFCSLVHFARNEDYTEDDKGRGKPKSIFHVNNLMKSWNEGTDYSLQIPSENDFKLVRNFVCKYDPDPDKTKNRYTTYCGIEVVEIRGNLCEKIAGLELVDSVGTNDDAISNEDQMTMLTQDSDAMILLERPQSQSRSGWTVSDCIKFAKKKEKVTYLIYNCYHNNIGYTSPNGMPAPSDLANALDNAHMYYARDCKRIYVSDIGEWEEVQSGMLVDMLFSLSESVEETHKNSLSLAKTAEENVTESVGRIFQIAKKLSPLCAAEKGDASEKKKNIMEIIRTLFGEVEKMIARVENEQETLLRARAEDITNKLTDTLGQGFEQVDFNTLYEYVSTEVPGYIHNRYTAFLCMYAHMLEDISRRYNSLKNDIDAYVENKRQELLHILWETGRFQCIMPELGFQSGSGHPGADKICAWLKKDAKELLAGVLEELLLKDIRAESLIDGSVGKLIEQFDPKNLTMEQLFGRKLDNPRLEKDESNKMKAIHDQLALKAKELEVKLFKSMGTAKPVKREPVNEDWIAFIDENKQNKKSISDMEPVQGDKSLEGNLFDLDTKVRRDVVCNDILKKFRDKLRGNGLAQNAEQPLDQLYDLYHYYYDRLLSEEEVSLKEHFNELSERIDKSAKELIRVSGFAG